MRALDIKLLRDARRLWAQSLAIALVLACGVATLILAIGAWQSLYQTREAYYERYRFASVFAAARRAPESLAARIRQIPGAGFVETRISAPVLLDIAGMAEPASGLALSIPDTGPAVLNRLYLRQGRLPQPGRRGEAVIAESFASAHGYRVGSRLSAIVSGRKLEFQVSGIALSPEFIYAIGPGDLVPDDRRYAVLWVRRAELAAAADLKGAFNSVSLTLLPGASEPGVIARLDRLLEPYGGNGAIARADQTSHAFIDSELKQLGAMARVIPPVFLVVSAFLINMILSRLIALEREQIGLLKAIGYSNAAVAMHYARLVLIIAVAGTLIGFAAGTWLGAGLTRLYGDFFRFPFLVFERDPRLYVVAGVIAIAAALAGAVHAVRAAAVLAPAVAMQPAPPPSYRRSALLTALGGRWLPQIARMAIRHMLRWPLRTAFTTFGTALAVALLVSAMFSNGAVDHMIDEVFFRSSRQDASIAFSQARPLRALNDARRLPGVLAAEPYRAAIVEVSSGTRRMRASLTGQVRQASLNRLLDTTSTAVTMPSAGLVLPSYVAGKLGVSLGQSVWLRLIEEGSERRIVVSQIVQSYIGTGLYMDIDAMHRLSREGPRLSGVHLRVDTSRLPELYAALKQTPQATSIALRAVSLAKFRQTIEQNITTMTAVYVALAVIIAFGVVYNSARIQLSERARELASLRVLGFTRREVAAVLLIELAIEVLLAQPLGWGLGAGLSWLIVQGFQSDLFRVPWVIERAAFGWSSAIVLSAAALSAAVVVARIARLDLIRVLKTRE